MKNNMKMILAESIKTSERSDSILTLKYTLTCENNFVEGIIRRNEEYYDSTCKTQNCDKCNEAESGDLPIYSLTVVSYIDGIVDDERCFEDISRNKDEAKRIFDVMSENTVTPETSEYILDELLSFGFAETQEPEVSVK